MARLILRTASVMLACTALASAAQTCDDDSCSPRDAEPGSVLLQRKQSIVKSHHAAPGGFSELIAKSAVTGFCKAHPCSVLLSSDAKKRPEQYEHLMPHDYCQHHPRDPVCNEGLHPNDPGLCMMPPDFCQNHPHDPVCNQIFHLMEPDFCRHNPNDPVCWGPQDFNGCADQDFCLHNQHDPFCGGAGLVDEWVPGQEPVNVPAKKIKKIKFREPVNIGPPIKEQIKPRESIDIGPPVNEKIRPQRGEPIDVRPPINEQIRPQRGEPIDIGPPINEQIKLGGIGELAAVDEGGYEMVSEVKDDAQMAEYIIRVIELYDCKVESMGGLMGIVPWFSGTTAAQGLAMLEEVLLSAVLSRGEHWVSYKNTAGVTGDNAPLTLSGYTEVAALRNDASMKRFVERVCGDMGVTIEDDAGLQGVIKYYSGSAAFQSFERLQSEIAAAAGAPHSWANWNNNRALLTKEKHTSMTGSAMFLHVGPRATSKGFCTSHPCSLPSLVQTGKLREIEAPAALDEAGYEEMAAKKDDNQMADYIQRVAAEYDCKVESMGGLMGIVPWFSGTSTVQTFTKLTEVLLFAVLAEGTPWLSFKNSAGVTGGSAPLDLNGYIQIAALRKDDEMRDFARRMCNDLKVKVLSEDGFNGMIKFYSGTSNFQSFERLQSEIKSAAASPHTWAEYE